MYSFGIVLFILSFILSFFLAKLMYKKRVSVSPDSKLTNFIIGVLWYVLFLFFLFVVSGFFISMSDKPSGSPADTTDESLQENNASAKTDKNKFVREIGDPKKYNILIRDKKSTQDDNRVIAYRIVSIDAISKGDRAATVKKAAQDLQAKDKAPVIQVFMELTKNSSGRGYIVARATYFSDGCDYSGQECNDVIWDIESSDYKVTEADKKILSEWYKNRSSFLKKDGDVDEAKLSAFVARKLSIPVEEIKLPYITTDKVNPFESEADKNKEIDDMKVRQQKTKDEISQAQARKKEIESQFSPWDGSHRDLERRIKDAMNDPDSYKHYKTVYVDHGDYITVSTEFGGKNGFGGMVRNTISADYSIDGTLIKVHQ